VKIIHNTTVEVTFNYTIEKWTMTVMY